jgi:hypothetical protein
MHSDIILILATIAVKQCTDISDRPHEGGVFNANLNCGGCFMLRLVYISYLLLVLVSGDRD